MESLGRRALLIPIQKNYSQILDWLPPDLFSSVIEFCRPEEVELVSKKFREITRNLLANIHFSALMSLSDTSPLKKLLIRSEDVPADWRVKKVRAQMMRQLHPETHVSQEKYINHCSSLIPTDSRAQLTKSLHFNTADIFYSYCDWVKQREAEVLVELFSRVRNKYVEIENSFRFQHPGYVQNTLEDKAHAIRHWLKTWHNQVLIFDVESIEFQNLPLIPPEIVHFRSLNFNHLLIQAAETGSWSAVCEIIKKPRKYDPISIAESLRKAGNRGYLAPFKTLLNQGPVRADHMAKIVIGAYKRKQWKIVEELFYSKHKIDVGQLTFVVIDLVEAFDPARIKILEAICRTTRLLPEPMFKAACSSASKSGNVLALRLLLDQYKKAMNEPTFGKSFYTIERVLLKCLNTARKDGEQKIVAELEEFIRD